MTMDVDVPKINHVLDIFVFAVISAADLANAFVTFPVVVNMVGRLQSLAGLLVEAGVIPDHFQRKPATMAHEGNFIKITGALIENQIVVIYPGNERRSCLESPTHDGRIRWIGQGNLRYGHIGEAIVDQPP